MRGRSAQVVGLVAALFSLLTLVAVPSACGAAAPERRSLTNSLGMTMVRIEPGSFTMGSVAGGDFDERPAHRVTLSKSFYLATTEVTNAQYEQFDAGHKQLRGKLGFSKADDEAVVFVSWTEATAFCRWLGQQEGTTYRLPTEAEWEYACRAGTTGAYWTGAELPKAFQKNVRNSWYPAPIRSSASAVVALAVAKTPPNPWGLYDMHGNVEEWCADWYGPYPAGPRTDPVGRVTGRFRVTRGGSHSTLLTFLRSANRSGMLPDDKTWLVGFRVALGPTPTSRPLPAVPACRCQQDVTQEIPVDPRTGPDPSQPYFKGPRRYVKIPAGSEGPLFSKHNHDPAIVECPNGDLLAIWYTCRTEPGRELGIAASRLRRGAEQWEPASPFWDVPDRNDHAPALWADGKGTLYHFNGLSAAGTWGSLATILRTSTDSGATWSTARLINPEHGLRHMPVESVFQTREGWIVLPCDAVPGGSGGTAIHISKDGGRTWHDPASDTSVPDFKAGGHGGSIAGIHAGVVQLSDGRLMAFGRGNNIDGHMPMSISPDMGRTWTYSASPFPPIGGNQRLVLMRLREGPLLLVSFTHDFFKYRLVPALAPAMYVTDAAGQRRRIFGMFAALSFDDGKTWSCRKPVTPGGPPRKLTGVTLTGDVTFDATHAEPRGYLSGCQTPDGIIHIISSGLHYAFNVTWVKTPIAAGEFGAILGVESRARF